MNADEQRSICTLNNFFCGLHLLVGMADESVVQQPFQILLKSLNLELFALFEQHVRPMLDLLPHFLLSQGMKKNPLVSFRGNHFNIVIYDVGALYHIAEYVLKFFKDVWQTPNELLKAVYSDIQVPEFVAGCCALGLINKIITGPL